MEKIRNFLFKNTSTGQTIAKNTFWIGTSTIAMKLIRVAIIIYAARILGTEQYGIFTYTMSLVGIFAIFSDIGLSNILTRELVSRVEDRLQYLSTSLYIKLGLLSATVLITILGSTVVKFEEAKSLIVIIALWIAFESLRNFFFAVTRSRGNMQAEAGLSIATEVICTVLVFIFFVHNPSIQSLATAYMIGSGIGVLITSSALRKHLSGIFTHFKRVLVKPIIRSAWPFAVMGVFSIFMANMDAVILSFFGDAHVLGLYAAAQRPISLLYILPGFLAASIIPIASKMLKDKHEQQLSTLTEKSVLISLGLALPIVIGGIIIAGPLIGATFGYEYIGAVPAFQILLLTLLAIFPGTIFADILLVRNKQKIFLRSSLWGAIINVVLDFLLIPQFGIVGSAIGTVVAQMVMAGIFFMEIRKSHTVNLLKGTKKMILAVLIMSISAYGLKMLSIPLIVLIPLSAVIYAGLLVVMKDQMITDIKQSLKS